jgi:hypothetical protein
MRRLAILLLLALAACQPGAGPYVSGSVGGNRHETSFR